MIYSKLLSIMVFLYVTSDVSVETDVSHGPAASFFRL
jgi:hypothetical protein